MNNSIGFRPSDQVEEVTSGIEGGGVCKEQCESEGKVESEGEKTESEGKKVESESEEIEVSEVLERPSVVMALGVHDGRHRGVPRTHVPQCRVVDVGTCDSILTREQLVIIRRTFNVSSDHRFILPSLGQRIRTPPNGCSTVYASYFDCGLSIPPHPLLVKIIRSFGICVS
ncbi:UNVERIFIED_CONTAM: hypothetical protein Sradi_5253000 [Sesamum radiatum]|uniref:Uncharacterized protein n=1 Tax=Sesamum radiatum TaxID=300843 RepID=A0AAW2LNL0_SESRA